MPQPPAGLYSCSVIPWRSRMRAANSTRIGFEFAARMRDRHGMPLHEYSPGGGWGIAYTDEDAPTAIPTVMRQLAEQVLDEVERHGFAAPRLSVEPGRAIVGNARLALY